MGSFTRKKGIKETSAPAYLPGQKEFIPTYVAFWRDVFNRPATASETLRLLAMREAGRVVPELRRTLLETPNLSQAAAQKLFSQFGEQTITAASGVPLDIWGMAADVLGKYAFAPPSQKSRRTGGGGWGFSLEWPKGTTPIG
ncbi:MAG: hypothetical protein QXQ53_01210 [Candidatus Methanosuratincola sp.]